MSIAATVARVEQARVIAIVRLPHLDPETAIRIAGTLVDEGLDVVEFTLNSPGAAEAISAVADRVPGCVVGAGTVLDAADARRMIGAGASLIVAPGIDDEVVAEADRAGVAVVPGAFTATEILQAVRAGAPLVKLFPAGPVGPGYLATMRGPLPDIRLVPTGGIGLGDIEPFLAAGAFALGLGSCLVPTVDPVDGLVRRAREVKDRLGRS